MGYTTKFNGNFHLNTRLFDAQALYLLEFAKTRRVKRDVAVLQDVPDPARVAVGLPLGTEGSYFANHRHEFSETAILDYNRPPAGQPGLWCHWVPTADAWGIQWDDGEKFYRYIEWLQYMIDHFLKPWGYLLSGAVSWRGEDPADTGQIRVVDNQIVSQAAEDLLREATSPVQVPLSVLEGLEAVQATGDTNLVSWVTAISQAEALGYPETAIWIMTHLEQYGVGLKQGFEAGSRIVLSRYCL